MPHSPYPRPEPSRPLPSRPADHRSDTRHSDSGRARHRRPVPVARDWRVERIDTEPMTPRHHDAAVTALAALIAEWKHNHENTDENRALVA